jgi:hypothetical protein
VVYLWRAVDSEGEVLDVLVQSRRNKRAALKLMRKLLKQYDKLVTDELRSYAAAAHDLKIAKRHERGRWRNNRSRLVDLGMQVFPRERQTPEAPGARVKADAEKWWPIIKESGIKTR